ncbi:MAG: hypothetical protein VX917_01825, partial [Chloroflexota bacterium]|nr:hypothetical protein [Chloroflexota bacterium]
MFSRYLLYEKWIISVWFTKNVKLGGIVVSCIALYSFSTRRPPDGGGFSATADKTVRLMSGLGIPFDHSTWTRSAVSNNSLIPS